MRQLKPDALNRLTDTVDGVGTNGVFLCNHGPVAERGPPSLGFAAASGPFVSDTVTNGYSDRLRNGLGLQLFCHSH
jgi:hypothetical protein